MARCCQDDLQTPSGIWQNKQLKVLDITFKMSSLYHEGYFKMLSIIFIIKYEVPHDRHYKNKIIKVYRSSKTSL